MMTDLPKKNYTFFVLYRLRVYQTGLTWKDQNLGRKVEVKYMNEPCNAC